MVPGAVTALLEARAAEVRADIVTAIRTQLPRFEPLARNEESLLYEVVGGALEDFRRLVATGGPLPHHRREFYAGVGRRQANQLGTMRSLSAACRVGMRVGWRHLAELDSEGEVDTETVWQLGETALNLVDEIIDSIDAGFREAGGSSAGNGRSHRQELLAKLLSDRVMDRGEIDRLARSAGWAVPESVCVVVLDAPPSEGGSPTPERILADLGHGSPRLLVPDPDRWRWLPGVTGAFRGARLITGPTVAVAQASRSLEQALEIRDLVRRGLVRPAPVLHCDDHLRALLLMRNRSLVKQLADQTLRPLGVLEPKKRARYGATLLAWLKARGNLADVAAVLCVHPQTVRYRMKEIHRLYGHRLDDSGFRFDLELVLRAVDALFGGGHRDLDTDPPNLREVLRERGINDLIDELG